MIRIELSLLSKWRAVLMALAISFVVFHHLTIRLSGNLFFDAYNFARVIGAFGVDIFLLVSGFGCFYSFSNSESVSCFYKRRIIRLIPAYFLICGFYYLILKPLILGETSFLDSLLDFSTISFWIRGSSEDWYIAAIIVFYLLYPLIYFAQKKRIWYVSYIFWGGIVVILMFLAPFFFESTNRFWARVPVFLFGSQIGQLMKNKVSLPKIPFILINLAVNACFLGLEMFFCLKGSDFAYSFWARLAYFPLATSFCFLFICLFENVKSPSTFLSYVGTITLEIYLLNQKLIDGCCKLFTFFFGKENMAITITGNIVGVFGTLVMAMLIHYVINMVIKKINSIGVEHQNA